MSAPAAKIAGRPQERGRVAVDRGLRREVGGAGVLAAYELAALEASVLSSAVPIEPPICWPVLTIAEATPASRGSTPSVAVLIAGAMIRPRPRPMTIRPGSTCVA